MRLTTSFSIIILFRLLPAIAWMGLIYALSDQSTLPSVPSLSGQITSVLGHLGGYFVLAVLLW